MLWWSPDSRYILVGGTRLSVTKEGERAGLLQLYILHDTQSSETSCNGVGSGLSRFDCDKLAALGFPIGAKSDIEDRVGPVAK